MNDKKEKIEKTNGGGIGIGGVLFVVFLILKLTHVIDWSWWWVTAPLWIPIGLALIIGTIVVIVSSIMDRW